MAEPAKLVTELTSDALSSVLNRLTIAHEIAAVAPTCRAFNLAVRHAIAARRFTGEVVTLAGSEQRVGSEGHKQAVYGVAAVPDGRILTASADSTVRVWRDGQCERTIQAHHTELRAVAVLPGGARFVSGALDGTAKLWTLDGTLVRTSTSRCWASRA